MGLAHGDNRKGKVAKEYTSWRGMLERCRNPNHIGFKYYGGRGIKVCDRWKLYRNFLEDMGRAPFSRFQLNRIDNDGDYEPGNCNWVSITDNSRNKRANRPL